MRPNHHHGAAAPGLAAPELAHHAVVGLAPLVTAGAALVGLSPPQTDESPGLAGGGAIEEQGKADESDCADAAAERKRSTTLRARLALAGWALTRTNPADGPADGPATFYAGRWWALRRPPHRPGPRNEHRPPRPRPHPAARWLPTTSTACAAWPLAWCCPHSEQQQAGPAAAAQRLANGVPAVCNPQDDFRAAVLAELGSAPDDLEYGRLHRFSLNGKASDTAGWCHLFDDGRSGVYGDFRSGLSSVWTATRRELMTLGERADLARKMVQARTDRLQAQQTAWSAEAPRIGVLWRQCLQVQTDGCGDDPVTLYLRHRLALTPGASLAVPDVIRRHPGLPYHHDGVRVGTWPAMVACIQAADGAAVALHRTWLTPEGRKAPTPGPVKKLSRAAGPVMGGCIRLAWPGAGASLDVMGIAEGIETALAARQASGVLTVAAYSAGALAAWRWPPGRRRLVIFADHDPAGAEAADKLRQRARVAGLSVSVMTPTTPGTDWCDVWATRAAVAVAASEAAA